MSQHNVSGVKAFPAGGALDIYLRVITPGALALAGSTDIELGTTERAAFALNDSIPVRLLTAPGTAIMVANGAITKGNPVYAASAGKVASSGSRTIGVALETTTADGDWLEVERFGNADVSGAVGGTTAAAFLVDSDSAIPKIELASYVGGTGDYKVTVKPAATLTANRTLTVPDATDTFVLLAATQTLLAKTLTSPTINGATINTSTLVTPVISTGLTASGSTANDFSGSTGTFKTSTGLHTFGGKASFKSITTPVAAAGSAYTNAAALGSGNVLHVSSDSAAKGVQLVAGITGDIVEVLNDSGTAAILYPATGGTINGLSANAGVVIPASKGTRLFCTAADTWIAFDMAAHSTAA